MKVGEQVLVGQKIGDSDAFISAPIHATISGKVTAIEKLVMTDGKSVDAVVITSDGENAVSPEAVSYTHLDVYKRQTINLLYFPRLFLSNFI